MGRPTPVNSPVGSRRPASYPDGLTIGFRDIYDEQITRISLQVRNPKTNTTTTLFFWRGNYAEKRMDALTRLAGFKGYAKIPSTWLEAVSEDHDGFLKECHIECTPTLIDSYGYRD